MPYEKRHIRKLKIWIILKSVESGDTCTHIGVRIVYCIGVLVDYILDGRQSYAYSTS